MAKCKYAEPTGFSARGESEKLPECEHKVTGVLLQTKNRPASPERGEFARITVIPMGVLFTN